MDVVLGKARSPTCLLLRSTHYPPFFPRFAHCTSTSICYPGVEGRDVPCTVYVCHPCAPLMLIPASMQPELRGRCTHLTCSRALLAHRNTSPVPC